MNREEILASGVYLVATMTPPEIVCPDWCATTADEHRSDLYQADGEVYHCSRRYEIAASAGERRDAPPPALEILISQTTFPDGTPSPLDEVHRGHPVLNIQGMEFTLAAAEEILQTVRSVMTKAVSA